jgi:hypothetical protein
MRRLKRKLASIPSFNGHYKGGLIEICKLTSMEHGGVWKYLELVFDFTTGGSWKPYPWSRSLLSLYLTRMMSTEISDKIEMTVRKHMKRMVFANGLLLYLTQRLSQGSMMSL